MTAISILPITDETGEQRYCAKSDDMQSIGQTPGEALDAIVAKFGQSQRPFFLLVPNFQPDQFFTAQQQERLAELMQAWKQARDAEQAFPTELQAELDHLVEAELIASRDRLASMHPSNPQ